MSQHSQILSPQEFSRLHEIRKLKKEKTPTFQRQESWRYKRIHEPWRKPKGVDSHMRLSVKGWPPLVKIGYRVPRAVRGLHPSGYRDVLVHNLQELASLSPRSDAARLAAGVGKKKRIEIARRAKELGIRVLNARGLLVGQKLEEVEEGAVVREETAEKAQAEEEATTRSEIKEEKAQPEQTTRLKQKRRTKKTKAKKKPTKKKTTSVKKKGQKKKKKESE